MEGVPFPILPCRERGVREVTRHPTKKYIEFAQASGLWGLRMPGRRTILTASEEGIGGHVSDALTHSQNKVEAASTTEYKGEA